MESKRFNNEEDMNLWRRQQDIYFENYYDEDEQQIDYKLELQKLKKIIIKQQEEAKKKNLIAAANEKKLIEEKKAIEKQMIEENQALEKQMIEENKALEEQLIEENKDLEKQFIEKDKAFKKYLDIINSRQLKIDLKKMKKDKAQGIDITCNYLKLQGYQQQTIQEYILNQLDDDDDDDE